MNYAELWDELKSYLVKAVPQMYELADKARYQHEEERLKYKANGMDLVLGKIEEYERSLLDKQNKDCLTCGHSLSIPENETHDGFAQLFCTLEQKEVPEDGYCKDFN